MLSLKPAVIIVGLVPSSMATARTHPSPASGLFGFCRSGRTRAISHSPPFVVGAFFDGGSNNHGNGGGGSGSNSIHTADQLRDQLDQLHTESETTRSKANSARLRLMRLTEAAENLQTRAAKCVSVGKETEARELLKQKKKLMQALEKSRNRIELLDRLSAKIHEAISLKETQLIEQVSKIPQVNENDFCQQIRFVSSKDDIHEVPNGGTKIPQCHDDPEDYEDLESQLKDSPESPSIEKTNDHKLETNLFSLASYDSVLRHAYRQLELVETSLEKFLRSQFMITESKKRYMHKDLQKMLEILKDVLVIRERLSLISGSRVCWQLKKMIAESFLGLNVSENMRGVGTVQNDYTDRGK